MCVCTLALDGAAMYMGVAVCVTGFTCRSARFSAVSSPEGSSIIVELISSARDPPTLAKLNSCASDPVFTQATQATQGTQGTQGCSERKSGANRQNTHTRARTVDCFDVLGYVQKRALGVCVPGVDDKPSSFPNESPGRSVWLHSVALIWTDSEADAARCR